MSFKRLNKIMAKLDAEYGSSVCPENLSRPPIKLWGFHLYRNLQFYAFKTRMNAKLSKNKKPQYEGVTYDEWSRRINKVCPKQFYFREVVLEKICDYLFIFDTYPRSFFPRSESIKMTDHLANIFYAIKKGELKSAKYIVLSLWYILLLVFCLDINYDNKIVKKYYTIKGNIKKYFFPYNRITFKRLPNNYTDPCTKLLFMPFEVFEEFMEDAATYHDYAHSEDAIAFWKECQEILQWWKEKGSTEYYENLRNDLYKKHKDKQTFSKYTKESDKLEKEIQKEILSYITRLYKIRERLWI
jgi:hypothetical protein